MTHGECLAAVPVGEESSVMNAHGGFGGSGGRDPLGTAPLGCECTACPAPEHTFGAVPYVRCQLYWVDACGPSVVVDDVAHGP